MPKPKINPVILLEPVEDGYIAYDPARDRLHQLNPIAALLTELCDANRSIAEIFDGSQAPSCQKAKPRKSIGG